MGISFIDDFLELILRTYFLAVEGILNIFTGLKDLFNWNNNY